MPPRKKMSKREARPAPASENQRLVGGWRDRLKMAMDKRNVSQRRLSQDSGLGPTTVRHLILQANTVSLDTCARLADGLGISVTWLMTGQHGVSDSTGNGDPKVVRALPIWTSMDVERAEPAGGEFVAVRSADYPADVRALRVPDQGLIPEGANLPPPPETILASGDIVLFTRTLQPDSGRLVVALAQRGAVVRRASYREDGRVDLLSNHHLFPKVTVEPKKILGVVIGLMRRMP